LGGITAVYCAPGDIPGGAVCHTWKNAFIQELLAAIIAFAAFLQFRRERTREFKAMSVQKRKRTMFEEKWFSVAIGAF